MDEKADEAAPTSAHGANPAPAADPMPPAVPLGVPPSALPPPPPPPSPPSVPPVAPPEPSRLERLPPYLIPLLLIGIPLVLALASMLWPHQVYDQLVWK